MTNEVGIGEHIKGFFWLHAAFVRKYFNILIIAITLGIGYGFTMVLFNYLLLFFRISFSYLPYFIRPVIAGVSTSLLVKLGNSHRIMGTGAADFIDDVNNTESKQFAKSEKKKKRKQNLLNYNNRKIDKLEVKLENGREIEVYFDITEFFGKGFEF